MHHVDSVPRQSPASAPDATAEMLRKQFSSIARHVCAPPPAALFHFWRQPKARFDLRPARWPFRAPTQKRRILRLLAAVSCPAMSSETESPRVAKNQCDLGRRSQFCPTELCCHRSTRIFAPVQRAIPEPDDEPHRQKVPRGRRQTNRQKIAFAFEGSALDCTHPKMSLTLSKNDDPRSAGLLSTFNVTPSCSINLR